MYLFCLITYDFCMSRKDDKHLQKRQEGKGVFLKKESHTDV